MIFALTVIGIYMTAWFVVSHIIKRGDVADIAWGMGFIVLSWALYIKRPSVQLSLAVILVTIWGIRLTVHIFTRNRKKSEDFRYRNWRESWGKWYPLRSFFQIFMLQGLLLVVVAAPLIALGSDGKDDVGFINMLGLVLWATGLFIEAVGDFELSQFTKKPQNKGKIMQSGLWQYSRHPNYFGEVLLWWGVWLVAFGTSYSYIAIIGPLAIALLILKVSGVPMLEKKYKGNKQYEQYKKRTSMFIPLPAKKT